MTNNEGLMTDIYQGQFGEFTIDRGDRIGVIVYRSGLCVAAGSFIVGTGLLLFLGGTSTVLQILTPLFWLFSAGLAVSLLAIHIYLIPLHRLLQVFFLTGTLTAAILAWQTPEPLALAVYYRPITLLGIGFTFAALTGIYFKEAFCFNRLETKLLTPLVPILLLGHLVGILPVGVERGLLAAWSLLFALFAIRKTIQPIPPDIGDKSVFAYLKKQGN
ncbi:MAG: DUF2301 domain-containing membrane protein [Cyanobacteriota bacterium]|nr:DUF2301 domain-containing membrane protein [Cyanobacteriota bacterium]